MLLHFQIMLGLDYPTHDSILSLFQHRYVYGYLRKMLLMDFMVLLYRYDMVDQVDMIFKFVII
jgi:hypothetical protein